MGGRIKIVALPRFELGQTEPKSGVLPLHHKAILKAMEASAPHCECKINKKNRICQKKLAYSIFCFQRFHRSRRFRR